MNITTLLRALLPAALLGIAGCASYDAARDTNARAASHLARADSLQRAGNFREALFECGLVVQLYPGSAPYPDAVRMAAHLSLNPANPAANDSAAVAWMSRYAALPVKEDDRTDALITVGLLRRLTLAEQKLAVALATVDSLSALTRKQAAIAASQTQRLTDAEVELRQAKAELTRLREVDVRLSRQRRRP